MSSLARSAAVSTAALVLLVGCSSTPTRHAATKAHVPAPARHNAGSGRAAAMDPCLVGTWVSSGVSGTVSNNSGSVHVPIHGGAGQIAVIRSDGIVALSYSAAHPQTGTGNDGASYTITTTGSLVGHLAAANGKATLTIDDPSAATQVVARNGTVVDREPAAKRQETTYTCGPGDKLAVTTGGITTSWVKDSGAAASSAPSSAAAAPSAGALKAPITNAIFARDTLLAQADGGQINSRDFPSGWQVDDPNLFVGYGFPADPKTVSGGYSFVTSKAKNVDYLAFAVKDTAGRCAAGLLVADSSTTHVVHAAAVNLPAGAACRGDEVAQAAGY